MKQSGLFKANASKPPNPRGRKQELQAVI